MVACNRVAVDASSTRIPTSLFESYTLTPGSGATYPAPFIQSGSVAANHVGL